jgi:hypothetical protein
MVFHFSNIRIQLTIRIKLLRLKSISLEVSFINGDLTPAYLFTNTIAISEQLISIALLIEETSGENL